MDMERKETKEEQQWRKIAADLGVALDGIKLGGVDEKLYFRAFGVDGDASMMSRFVTFITRLQATHQQQPGATMTMAGGQQVEEATAASTAVATNSSAAPVSCSDYQKGKHWEGIQRQLDQLDSSGFKLSTLPVAKYNGISIPLVKGEPSLLLYGLTATDRYNGAAQSLLEQIKSGVQWLLLQAVSGAGKTRAILDVFANSTLDRTLLYFDLSSLPEGNIPTKNFGQADVQKLGDHLSSKQHDRKGATILFKGLIAARRMVVHYLRGKGWDAESLLIAQLSLHGRKEVCEASASVFKELAGHSLLDYSELHEHSIVAIDESNAALLESLGMFESATPNNPERPLLCCVGAALKNWPCIFSGTSFSHDQFDEAVVSNVAGRPTPRFSSMTKMDTVADVEKMMARFNIDTRTIPPDYLVLLTGRCRLVANAIICLIQNELSQTVVQRPDEVVLESIHQVQQALSKQMKARLSRDHANRTLVENLLVGTLLEKTMKYSDLPAPAKDWADQSLVWVSGSSQSVQLNEPILVQAAKDAFGGGWDPVKWIVSRMSTASAAQQGYDFEQVAARKVAAALLEGKLDIQDANGKSLSITEGPDAQTATTVSSGSLTLDEFLGNAQTRAMFLPANKDGPDVVFWVLCDNGKWYAVLIQAKYYKTKISGQKTVAAVDTLYKPPLPKGVAALRIFFPFMGATCSSDPTLLEDEVDGDDNYMYLDHENAGHVVLGADLCTALEDLKDNRNEVPP